MNNVSLIGRLTKDVDVRYTTTNNTMVAIFTLAVNRRGTKDKADFIQIIAYGKTAEFCSKYFKKGQQVGVVGSIQTRNYDDKDGKRVYVTEIVANEVCFADSKQNNETEFVPDTDDTLPF